MEFQIVLNFFASTCEEVININKFSRNYLTDFGRHCPNTQLLRALVPAALRVHIYANEHNNNNNKLKTIGLRSCQLKGTHTLCLI